MSHLPTTSAGTRATSSRYGLRLLAHRLEGQPRDSESQPQDPVNDPEAELREDTARRLAELLDRPGVDGSLIAGLLGYDVEDRSAQDYSDPEYVEESRTDEATPSLAQARPERANGALADPLYPARQQARSQSRGLAPSVSRGGRTRPLAEERATLVDDGADSRSARRTARPRATSPRPAPSADLRERLTAQRNSRGEDLRQRLNSRRDALPAATLGRPQANVVDQASNERQPVTPVAPTVGPANGLDMVTMIQSLQNQIIEMRESGRQRPYGWIEESYSPFAAQVLAQPYVGNFKLPSIPPTMDGRTPTSTSNTTRRG